MFSEKHTDLRDTTLANWTRVAPSIGRQTWVANQGYEGPLVFKANPGDTSCPEQFYFWADRYTNGGGYQLSCSADIEAPVWTPKTPRFTNTGTVRHGTVTPLTLREWNRILGNENPPVATTTELALSARTVPEGDAFTATVTVRAADGFQVGGRVRLSAPGWQETVYLDDDGVASVTVPGRAGAGERTVVAEYLGHDVLTAPQDTGSILVTPRVAAPVGGEVPATLSLSLGAPVSFGAFTPGVAREYLASTTATVTSTAARRRAQRVGGHAGQRRVQARATGRRDPGKDGVVRPRQQRHVPDRVQAVDRCVGAAAHGALQRERHVHAVDHDAVGAAHAAAPCGAPPPT